MNVLDWPQRPLESRNQEVNSRHSDESNVVRRTSFSRQMWYDQKLPGELVANLWNDADRLLQTGKMLKDGVRCTVVQVHSRSASTDRKSFVLKRYNLRGPLHTALHLLLRTRARNCWHYGRQLMSNGIASPQPLAFLEYRFGPLRTRSFLLTEFVHGTNLTEYVLKSRPSSRLLRVMADEFATVWGALGELRLGHGDMKATNFLVTRDHRLWLIDLDGMRTCRNQFAFRCARNRDWRRFMKNWIELPHVALSFHNSVTNRINARLRIAA